MSIISGNEETNAKLPITEFLCALISKLPVLKLLVSIQPPVFTDGSLRDIEHESY